MSLRDCSIFDIRNDELFIQNDELFIQNDEFCIANDEFRVENDVFRIENDEFCIENNPASHGFMGWVLCCPVGTQGTTWCDL